MESLDADADHRQRVDAGFRRCELHGRRREDRLVDARLVDRLGIVADHHGVAFHERFHAVDARHFLHLRGEGLRAAEALYRGESLDFVGLHAFDLLVFAPLLVDGRKFPVAAEPQRRAEERDGQRSERLPPTCNESSGQAETHVPQSVQSICFTLSRFLMSIE